MSVEPGTYHAAAEQIAETNRFLRKAAVAAVCLMLAAAVTVITWGAIRLGGAVDIIQSRQVQFHHDSTCQTQSFDQLLIELSQAQRAQQRGATIPHFVYPAPC